jgi:tetratricopeptide (TPR) repeat protein
MAARYSRLADVLPPLLEELTQQVHILEGRAREDAYATLAVAYRCLDAIANKLGYLQLSYLAVDRVCWAAQKSADPLMVATGSYLRGQACLDVGHFGYGLQLLERARAQIESHGDNSKEALAAVHGSLHMRSAVLAACDRDSDTGWSHISEAQSAAERLGSDVTYYWTFFGPNNVAIHTVAAAVELGDYARAIDEARTVQLSPAVPLERSSHHLIDLARAYLWEGDRDQSLKCLLRAEHIAPHHTRHHPATRSTVRTLLELARGSPDDLVALAARVGLIR